LSHLAPRGRSLEAHHHGSVLRGNSASGKSAVAAEIRNRYGRGLAIAGQDNLRRPPSTAKPR
jgi:hypothetical protein